MTNLCKIAFHQTEQLKKKGRERGLESSLVYIKCSTSTWFPPLKLQVVTFEGEVTISVSEIFLSGCQALTLKVCKTSFD